MSEEKSFVELPTYTNPDIKFLIDEDDLDIMDGYNVLWNKNDNKLSIWKDGNQPFLHRLIWEKHYGTITNEIDHKNRNRLDNRLENLREATRQENCCNRKKFKGNHTSNFKGVFLYKQNKKWTCQIQVDKKKIHLGYYDSELDAAKVYNIFASYFFNEYACLNEIPEEDNTYSFELLNQIMKRIKFLSERKKEPVHIHLHFHIDNKEGVCNIYNTSQDQ